MITQRQQHWPTRLSLFLEEKRSQPFKWGENDCCLWICDWICILTGEDPASTLGLRGTYTTALGALRNLKRFGGLEVLASRVAEERGWTKSSVQYASRGDVVILQTKDGPAVGVCNGAMSFFVGATGILQVPTNQISIVWHIP